MDYQALDFLKDIAKTFRETQRPHILSKFNSFKLISKRYHYENFHSDIIAFLLTPNGNHGCGRLFLNQFLDVLKLDKSNPVISNYNDAQIQIEKIVDDGRVDILITDLIERKAIIIESKLNNAVDQKDQLNKYYNHVVHKDGYAVEAVIYLSMDGKKAPPDCNNEVKDKLINLAAFNTKENDLYNGWLQKCISQIDNIDVVSFVRQYAQLYKILGKEIMDYKNSKPFFDAIKNDLARYEAAITIKDMVNELPQTIAQYFNEKNQQFSDVFKKIEYYPEEPYQYWAFMSDCHLLNDHNFDLTLDIQVKDASTIDISVFERTRPVSDENDKTILLQLNVVKNQELEFKDGRYRKCFDFPSQESNIDKIITKITTQLREIKNHQSPA